MNNKMINTSALKVNIINAVRESCETTKSTIFKVLDAVRNIKYDTIEPGVELVDSLKSMIRVSVQKSVEHGCDTGVVIRGLIIGAFRSRDTVRQEAHKTIDRLVQLIFKEAINAGADPKVTTEAIIKGIMEIARVNNLNLEESLSEAGTSAVLASYSMDHEIELKVRETLSKSFSKNKIILKEEFLTKSKESLLPMESITSHS